MKYASCPVGICMLERKYIEYAIGFLYVIHSSWLTHTSCLKGNPSPCDNMVKLMNKYMSLLHIQIPQFENSALNILSCPAMDTADTQGSA